MSDNLNYNNSYSLRATDVTLAARANAPALGSTPSTVFITSEGAGNAFLDGSVIVNGNGQVMVQSGRALLGLISTEAKSDVSLLNGINGTMTFCQGGLIVSPTIKMEDTKLALTIGALGVGAKLVMTPTGITIAFAEWTIELGSAGIELKVGPNSIKLSPDGIKLNGVMVNVEALSLLSLKGLNTTCEAELALAVKGLMTQIG